MRRVSINAAPARSCCPLRSTPEPAATAPKISSVVPFNWVASKGKTASAPQGKGVPAETIAAPAKGRGWLGSLGSS